MKDNTFDDYGKTSMILVMLFLNSCLWIKLQQEVSNTSSIKLGYM
jgi:hypothetical protein